MTGELNVDQESAGQRTFSGKFNPRLGPDLHKKIALEAAERNESMNTHVMKKPGAIDA